MATFHEWGLISMVVFEYRDVTNPDNLIEHLESIGFDILEADDANDAMATGRSYMGFRSAAIYVFDECRLEVYPFKNTNAVAYFDKRYHDLRYTKAHVVKTKRWSSRWSSPNGLVHGKISSYQHT